MSGSNWRKDLEFGLIALACALLIALPISGLMLGEYAEVHRTNAAYQENAEKDRKAASEEIAKSCFETDFAVFSKCITEKIAAYYKQQATNEDLQAQQDMAYWAKTLFFLGILQLGFSGAGIYFIWKSLALNRAAVKAAVDSNEVTREFGQVQSRAYVSVEGIDLYLHSGAGLIARVKNSGQTPCLEYWIESAFYSVPEVKAVEFDSAREMPKGIVVHGISSGREMSTPINSQIVKAVFDDALIKSLDLVVQGKLYYRTFFEELFFSEFVYYATPPLQTFIREGKEIPLKFVAAGNLNLRCHQKAKQ